ncbi:MAG: N-acetylneuraminate synthase family protein [Deltaproteobacteria bacterium]|nr:N-acetylneuraminate synthase family protein [Deltaproteobacteria bacterium]MBI3294165.1 N-acetylneuraminate synthase family protein [Deltaproteobacteria bacterium]
MRQIRLGSCDLSENSLPYVIAEIGVNHEGSLERAKKLIELAQEGGADAAKFQTYKAGKLASKHSPSYWDLSKEPTTNQFDLFSKLDAFGPEEYRLLAKHCEQVGIDFLSTPFDDEAVDLLAPLMPFFKVASADLTTTPLLRRVARFGKPIVLSTGASRLGEVDEAIRTLTEAGCREIALLHCVLNYPTPDPHVHLNMIPSLMERYPNLIVGYSDHSLPDSTMTTLTAAYSMGARIIEKHFTNDKSLPGNDHYHAMDSCDCAVFVRNARRIQVLLGSREKAPLPSEEVSRKNARRSIVLAKSVKKGQPLSELDITYKRPGLGVSPLHWDRILGTRVTTDLTEDHVLQWKDLDLSPWKDKVVAVVQARMGSTRFPGKMMAKIGDRPLISWVLERVQRSKLVNQVILASSSDPRNDALETVATELGIQTVRGDENDVLSRFVLAAQVGGADIVVRVCADNPFIEPEEIDRVVTHFLHQRPDYAFNHVSRLGNGYADGFGAEVLSAQILGEIDRVATCPAHREHVTSYLWDHAHEFEIATFPAPDALAREDLRFDIDTGSDLARLGPMGEALGIGAKAAEFIQVAEDHSL